MAGTAQTATSQTLQERIAAARARQAELEAQARAQINQPQIDHFVFLVGLLFGADAITTLGARVEWRDRPTLIIPWNGAEQELVAVPKPTGHVGWQLGSGIELFEQKYAPPPAEALDKLLVSLEG
jgi:hypothetical protein